MARAGEFRLSKRHAGKRRTLKGEVADYYEETFKTLLGGVKPPPVAPVDLPAGVKVGRFAIRRKKRPSLTERERKENLKAHAEELLHDVLAYLKSEEDLKLCVRCQERKEFLNGDSGRLQRTLVKILGTKYALAHPHSTAAPQSDLKPPPHA